MTAGKLPAGLCQRALQAADSPSGGGLCDSRVYGLWRGAWSGTAGISGAAAVWGGGLAWSASGQFVQLGRPRRWGRDADVGGGEPRPPGRSHHGHFPPPARRRSCVASAVVSHNAAGAALREHADNESAQLARAQEVERLQSAAQLDELTWENVTIAVDGQRTPFQLCQVQDDWWVAVGRGADADLTLDSRHVPLAGLTLVSVTDLPLPEPQLPPERPETPARQLPGRCRSSWRHHPQPRPRRPHLRALPPAQRVSRRAARPPGPERAHP